MKVLKDLSITVLILDDGTVMTQDGETRLYPHVMTKKEILWRIELEINWKLKQLLGEHDKDK